jgi:hypothetical protein
VPSQAECVELRDCDRNEFIKDRLTAGFHSKAGMAIKNRLLDRV